MNFAEAARIMMSGGGSVTDSRVQRLDQAPISWGFRIGDYLIKIKISSDVDYSEQLILYDSENVVKDDIIWYGIYYCVYYRDEFMFAVSDRHFREKYHLCNLGADTRIIDTITENYNFYVRNGTMELQKSNDFLTINLEGVYTQKISSYTGYDHILSNVSTSLQTFSHSCNCFHGSSDNECDYIIPDGVGFYGTVIDLFNACRTQV